MNTKVNKADKMKYRKENSVHPKKRIVRSRQGNRKANSKTFCLHMLIKETPLKIKTQIVSKLKNKMLNQATLVRNAVISNYCRRRLQSKGYP